MSPFGWLAIYSGAILAVSLFGGCVPFLGRVTHSRLQLYLSFSAGVMLGASFFHVMPDAMEMAGAGFGWWMALGVVGLFCIERFIAPHSHEVSSKLQEEHDHQPGCEHDHAHRAAPAVAGWMAVLGLTIHTLMNGVGLAGAVQFDAEKGSLGYWALPGLALFLAIALHKPADALAISMVLSRKGASRGTLTLVQLGFAAMVPVGAAVFLVTTGRIATDLQNQLTGGALAFSAGTFLFIALSDLLPEVQFHRHDRIPLSLALVLGVVLMGGIALLEGHNHAGDDPTGTNAPAKGRDNQSFDPGLALTWPGAPTESSHVFPTKWGELKSFNASFREQRSEGVVFFWAFVYEYPDMALRESSAQELLTASVFAFRKDETSRKEIKRGLDRQYPGLEIVSRRGRTLEHRLVVMAGPRLYDISVSSTNHELLSGPEVRVFFDSLVIEK